MTAQQTPEKTGLSLWEMGCFAVNLIAIVAACFIPPAEGPPVPRIAWITAGWLGGGVVALMALFWWFDLRVQRGPHP